MCFKMKKFHQYTINSKNKNIEITLSKYYEVIKGKRELNPIYKVTRKYPLGGISDTLMFGDLKKAKKQVKEWKK